MAKPPAKPLAQAIAAMAGRIADRAGNSHAAKLIYEEAKGVGTAAEGLSLLAAQRRPTETRAAHLKRVTAAAKLFLAKSDGARERAAKAGFAGKQDVQRRIDERVRLVPNEYATEVRAGFRMLDREGKLAALQRMVEENSGPELAAIVRVPPIAVGLNSAAEQAQWEKVITAKHAAAELDEMAAIDAAWEAMAIIGRTSYELVKSLDDPLEMARIEQAEAEADAAVEAFNQSLQ
jgi:hypothetical protein